MRIGFGAPVSGAWAGPENLAHFASRAEELGYASLWTFQRLLTPADPEALPPVYRSVLDPVAPLAYVAALTSRIRLGIAVVNLPFVSPAFLAKQASTLDLLSRGRLDLGLGTGWQTEEFVASGVPMERRGARAEEYLLALRTLLTDEVSSFDGEFYTVPPSRMAPKPGGLALLLGGSVPAALRRAGRLADGWMSRSATDLTKIAGQIAVVREAAERAGKDPAAVRIVVRGVVRAGGDASRRLGGSYEKIREDTAWLGEQGVTEVFYDLNWDPQIGNPAVDPGAATARAEEILTELAPAGQ